MLFQATASNFQRCWEPSWGSREKRRTTTRSSWTRSPRRRSTSCHRIPAAERKHSNPKRFFAFREGPLFLFLPVHKTPFEMWRGERCDPHGRRAPRHTPPLDGHNTIGKCSLLWRCLVICFHWGVSSIGRAPPLQGGGYRFDPDTLHFDSLRAIVRRKVD